MSIRVMSAVWEQDDLDQGETLVMLALADWANDAGRCWPSMSQIAHRTRMTERGCQLIIKRLVAKGYLARDEIVGRGVNYIVQPPNYVRPRMKDPPNKDAKTPERGSPNTSINHHTSELFSPTSESNLEPTGIENNSSGIVDPKSKTPTRKSAWSSGDVVPEEYLQWAITDRLWTRAEAELEAQRFIDSALANRRLYADWLAAWRNWCRSPYCKTPKGEVKKPVRIDRW